MAEVKELDYRITFPSPTLRERTESIDEDFVESLINSPTEPVVILLGWAGCQEKHLKKYASIYDKRCITIQYTAPVEDIFYRSQNLKVSAEKILELITDLSLEENPIVLHVFSNGGGMLYRQISQLITERPEFQTIHVIGSIFDSLPSNRNPITAAKAYMLTVQGNFMLRYVAAAFVCVLVFILWVYNRVKLWVGTVDTDVDYWEYMTQEPVRWPYLYLYSKVDDLVSYRYVEEIMAIRKGMSADIQSVCWDDSPHVEHFRRHREPYILKCHQFINHCLGKAKDT